MSEEPRRFQFADNAVGVITRRSIEIPTFSSKTDAGFYGSGDSEIKQWVLEQIRKLGIEAKCEGTELTVTLTGKP